MIDKDNYHNWSNEPSPNWEVLNSLGRTYVGVIKEKDAAEKRCLSIQDLKLLKMGLLKKVIVKNKKTVDDNDNETDNGDNETGDKRRAGVGYKLIPIDDSPEIAAKIEYERDMIKSTKEYDLMYQQFRRLEQQKDDLKTECKKLFPPRIWAYCESVKGMKEVAAMTFCGFINPQQKIKLDDGVTDSDKFITLANVKAHFGITPKSRLRKGQQGNFSPLMKGRLLGVVIPGVIRARDNYYKPLFDIKKQYYRDRPDLKHELECDGKKCDILSYNGEPHKSYNGVENKGWKAKINWYAQRWLGGMVLSHAFECMCRDEPMRQNDDFVINHHERHRDPVPIKPSDSEEWLDIHINFTRYHERMLDQANEVWDADHTSHKTRYFEWLKNNRVT